MGTTFRYPQGGEPEAVHFDVTGRYPTQEEAVRLTSMTIEKKPASGAEIKNALKWFAVGIAIGVAVWFFGRWVIGNFRGFGVLFFGYGFAYIGAPAAVIFGFSSLFKLFRSAQKKKPEAALRWVYEVSYMGDDTAGTRFGKLDYAVATLERIIPGAMGFNRDMAKAYITGFRETMIRAMEITTAKARTEPPGSWTEGSPQTQMKIEGSRELYPGVLEMSATLVYKDILSRSDTNNNTINMIAAVLELHIVSVLIQSGKYWYPYDVFPAATCLQELPATLPAGE
jgi:hypothetical protein